jgi:hypothetical protein
MITRSICSRSYPLLAGALLAACAAEPQPLDLPDDLLVGGEEIVEVRRPLDEETSDRVARERAPTPDDHRFFLAIRKDALARRWFLSAYAKQFHPDGPGFVAASSLGTRVVSFRVQNDKIFVFDASDQFKASDIFDPDVLLEAYPIVELDDFDRLRGSRDYVLFDPAAGMNRFLVTGQLYADPFLSDFGAFPLEVGLSYMQGFRSIADGVTYEQVFAGQLDDGFGFTMSVWGTLGVSLRRYQVGEGYVPTPDPGTPHYFLSDTRLIPGSGDGFPFEANPVRWNLHPGRPPIQVFITAGAQRAQADFPDVDIIGAFTRGIENWNEVVGYDAFQAVLVDDDEVRDNDASTALIDYPGRSVGFAFADWRSNPNNGELLGASVFVDDAFFRVLPTFEDDPLLGLPNTAPRKAPEVKSLLWGGMPARRPACVYLAPDPDSLEVQALRADRSLTAGEKGTRYLEQLMSHEWGHAIGLRHNFKGSLLPTSSSVMEYLPREARTLVPRPGSYDIDAVRYLYQLSPELPAQPFCTDEDVGFDPDCRRFDLTANPLREFWPGIYEELVSFVLDQGVPADFLFSDALFALLDYAVDGFFLDSTEHLFAAQVLLGRSQVPLDPADAADPLIAAQASAMADFVLRALVGTPTEPSFFVLFDISDPAVIAYIADQTSRMALNEDGVRTFALRRTAVDVLKKLQTDTAFLALRAVQGGVAAALDGGTVPPEDVPLTQDLLARIDAALSPYFD